jgi:hypothetical protein
VADQDNHLIRVASPDTTVATHAGGASTFAEGVGTSAGFNSPHGVAVGTLGRVFVADTSNHRVRVISATRSVTTHAGSGVAGFFEGIGLSAQLNTPIGVAADTAGNVCVFARAPTTTWPTNTHPNSQPL